MRAVERALAILSVFTTQAGDQTLETISRSVGLPKSTTHRLISTLVMDGFMDTAKATGGYRLGLECAILGSAAISSRRPADDVHAAIERLRAETDETFGLSALHGRALVIEDKVESSHPLRYVLPIGASAPAHCTASGKVLLASLEAEQVHQLFSNGQLAAHTRKTITSFSKLVDELQRVADQGYATDDEEFANGLRCVAVPVCDDRRRVVYALAASGPSARLSLDRLLDLIEPLRATSREITRILWVLSPSPR